jgi:hypothetical protein
VLHISTTLEGAQRVPPARLTLAVVDLDRHLAGITDLERPPAVAVALGRDQIDPLATRSSGATAARRR